MGVSNLLFLTVEQISCQKSSFHPQSNSCCERYNSFISQTLRACVNKEQSNWHDILPGVMMAFRLTPAKSTLFSPYKMLFGREMNLPFDTSVSPLSNMGQDSNKYFQEILRQLKITEEIAEENVRQSQIEYKKYYDKTAKSPSFKPGDLVLLKNQKVEPGLSPKLTEKFIGPYYVTLVGPNDTYKIRLVENNKEHKSMVHVNRLRKYTDPCERIITNTPTPNDAQDDNDQTDINQDVSDQTDNSWEPVRKLIGTKVIAGKRCYKVQWENPNLRPEWVDKQDISDHLIQLYHIDRTLKGTKRKRKQISRS